MFAKSVIPEDRREVAERIVAERARPAEAEIAAAREVLESFHDRSPDFSAMPVSVLAMMAVPVTFTAVLIFFVAIPALIAALVARGGLALYVLGIAVVTGDRSRASRLRVFWRSLVTWPLVILSVVLVPLLVVVVPLAVWSVATRKRSLQDRIAGTWLVPR